MYAWFSTDVTIRPDDIDLNNHVHNSRYVDFVLAARYDQMARCYLMSMEEFVTMGFSWVNTETYIQYRRPMRLGQTARVWTRISEFYPRSVRVEFRIDDAKTAKECCRGHQMYTMVSTIDGRSVTIPDDIRQRYAILEQTEDNTDGAP
jgi:acyl-CoA thioester hydrolase/thioesterase-3